MFGKSIVVLLLTACVGILGGCSEIRDTSKFPYDEEKKYCTIKSNESVLLYKNQYETDELYFENIIYLDEEAKENMTSIYDPLDVGEVLYLGLFKGEFIRVRYSEDISGYRMSLAHISDGEFMDCKTNKIIRKAFDKDGNEIPVPKFNYTKNDVYEEMKIYSLMDITTENSEKYIVGIYVESFSGENPNNLVITTVLKKENMKIDVNDEKQVEEFWKAYANYKIEKIEVDSKKDYEPIDINGEVYYHRLTDNTWSGEYHQDDYYTTQRNEIHEVVSYKEYLHYLRIATAYEKEKVEPYYKDKNSNYIILSYSTGHSWCDFDLIDCVEENNKVIIYGVENVRGVMASGSGFFVAIPTQLPVGTEVEFRNCYSTQEISNLINYGSTQTEISIDKPIIYLYPTTETKVNVKLINAYLLTCVYPEYDYEKGWNVIAKQNGELIDINTKRSLYSLYYESEAIHELKIEKEGFVIKGEDIAQFLEEKLAILGLSEREANEFIIYWLPILQENKYNYIRFATEDEINQNMPLNITPNPDTTIRVLMTYKGLERPIEVEEQELVTPERNGFVAVEWGGTEIK